MASNSLVANSKKTGFLLIRNGKPSQLQHITVGDHIIQEETSHKILGLTVDNHLKWDCHVYGKNGVLSSVNQRVGALKRLSYHVPKKYLPQFATATISSKIRYCISIYGSVRIEEQSSQDGQQKDLQVALNKAMRIVAGKKLSDRVSIRDLCEKTRMTSVNHMSALDKISLTWNSLKNPSSPLNTVFNPAPSNIEERVSRAKTRGDMRPSAKTTIGQRNLPHSVSALWNACDATIKSTALLNKIPKGAIRTFVKTLPI